MTSRRAMWVILIGMALLIGYVIYGSMARVEVTCELCVELNGRTECRRGAGADRSEAIQAAQISACGTLASGMDETIRCQNLQPKTLQCSS